MPLLIATEGALKGERFPLRAVTTLGRADDADIQIADLMVTRHHCRIVATAEGYFIEDLGSRNGTYVNDALIQAPTRLRGNDRVRIYNAAFLFREEGDTTLTIVDVSEAEPPTVADAVAVQAAGMDGRSVRESQAPEALAKAHERLRIIVETSKAVREHVDRDVLLTEIMDSFFRVFPQMDRGFIMLRPPKATTMEVVLARQRDPSRPQTISVSRHIISEAARRRIGILSADAMGDARFAASRSVITLGIRSMMCAPLIAEEEILGVAHVDTTSQDQRFTHDDLELFTAVANQMALAISYTRMHEQLRARQRMEHDLAMARQVQQSFLPSRPPIIPGLEFSARYEAAQEVGGDFYDFIPLPDGRLAVVLGDVMGKGMPAALLMVRMMRDLRFLAAGDPRPGPVLARLNDALAREMENSFVTVLYLLLDPAARTITLANAGHWPPVLRQADGRVCALDQPEAGFAIGTEPGTPYEEAVFSLHAGDRLVLFTDGVTEAQNAAEETYGLDRLTRALAVPQPGVSALMDALLADVRAFAGDTPLGDDLTLLCLGAT